MLTVEHLKTIMPTYDIFLSNFYTENKPVVIILSPYAPKHVDIWNVNDKDGNTLCLEYHEYFSRVAEKRIKWVPNSPESDELLKATILGFLA